MNFIEYEALWRVWTVNPRRSSPLESIKAIRMEAKSVALQKLTKERTS